MRILEEPLPGVFLVQAPVRADERGCLVKPISRPCHQAVGLEAADWVEQFFSVSHAGVLRGMHLQVPPHAHAKLVYCVQGRMLDVVVDLRAGPNFGRCFSTELSGGDGRFLLVPRGVAHGFYAHERSIIIYNTTGEHVPGAEAGVRWDSIGFDWPEAVRCVSERDKSLPGMGDWRQVF